MVSHYVSKQLEKGNDCYVWKIGKYSTVVVPGALDIERPTEHDKW